jgi:hypothetical protein
MEIRDCKFCQNKPTYSPLDRMEEFGIKVYFCHPCQAEYLYFSREGVINEEPSSASLYVKVNNKMYRWSVLSDGRGQLWLVNKPGIPGSKINEGYESVFHTYEVSNITPQNIKEKIRTWLMFM